MKITYLDPVPAQAPARHAKITYLDPEPAQAPQSAPSYLEPLGPLEAVASLAAGTAGSALGGLAGLADIPLHAAGITKTEPADVVRNIERFSQGPLFAPQTSLGRMLTSAVTWPFQKLGEVGRSAGESVLSKTGSPLLATAADTAIQASPIITGEVLKVSPAVRGTVASRAATAAKRAHEAQDVAATQALRQAGYRLPPASASPGLRNSILQGLSGSAKVEKRLEGFNQNVSNQLAREELGLPQDYPLTPGSLEQYRERMAQPYQKLSKLGTVVTGPEYAQELANIEANYSSAARSFKGLPKSPIKKTLDSLNVKSFDAGDAIAAIRELRSRASDAYSAKQNSVGSALSRMAYILEKELDRHLERTGADPHLIDQLRFSRQKIAQSYTVQKALNPTGHVIAQRMGRFLEKGEPLTGKLKLISLMGSKFRRASGLPEADTFGFGDIFLGGGLGLADVMGGGRNWHGLPIMAGIGVRPAIRALLTSPIYQRFGIHPPSYAPGFVNPSLARVFSTYSRRGVSAAQNPQKELQP